jgi:hypothetical protein
MGKKDRTDDATLYKEGLGHMWHGTAPDEIHRRPELYQDYTTDLAKTLATRLHGDNQEAVDAAVARAQSRSQEFAQLTVEAEQKNTHKHRREKAPPMNVTNHTRASKDTVRDFRARIYNLYPETKEGAAMAMPDDHDIPHHKIGDKRADIQGFVNTIPLDSVGDVNKSEQFIDKAEGAREEYVRQMRDKDKK